jgi:hypothetical protein
MKNLILGLIMLLSCSGCERLENGAKHLSDDFIDVKVITMSDSNCGTNIYSARYKNSKIPVLIRLECPCVIVSECKVIAIPIDELNICNQEKDIK